MMAIVTRCGFFCYSWLESFRTW